MQYLHYHPHGPAFWRQSASLTALLAKQCLLRHMKTSHCLICIQLIYLRVMQSNALSMPPRVTSRFDNDVLDICSELQFAISSILFHLQLTSVNPDYPTTVASSLKSSQYWDIGENYSNWSRLRPKSRLSQKKKEFIYPFTPVHQTSNRHIQVVMHNLK